MPRIYVGVGSNSEPGKRLRAAVDALDRVVGPVRCSSVYRSAAVGEPAPDYLNLVVAFDCERGPEAVKSELVAIETAAGRARGGELTVRSALCVIDLDLLIHGARVEAARRLPHLDVLRRTFVLGPLAELAPELPHPVSGERLASAWVRLGASAPAIEKVGSVATLG